MPPSAFFIGSACLIVFVLAGGSFGCRATPQTLRIASFNANLSTNTPGEVFARLESGRWDKAAVTAEIIQRTAPDIVLINEFDQAHTNQGVERFQSLYLKTPQDNANTGTPSKPTVYPYVYTAPVNTGVPTELDLDRDGQKNGPADAQGFGRFPGQYSMVLLSKHPILHEQVRSFQTLLWQNMPQALLPKDWYPGEAQEVLRLSSKSHWDVPIQINGHVLHVLCAHPTPPAFDGPEDRNGKRNHDEIRLWADYVSQDATRSAYLLDDQGVRGGLTEDRSFVILGDYNADPRDGGSHPGAIQQLLDHPRINGTLTPTSRGANQASERTGGINAEHRSDPAADTGDFNDATGSGPGNLRVDYALPAKDLVVINAGVFWPEKQAPLFPLVGDYVPGSGFRASDHRLVWIDVGWPPHKHKRHH